MTNFDYTVINNSKSSNLDKINALYNEKLGLLNSLLEDFNNNKNNPNFDFTDHYLINYAPRFSSIGGKISGCVRNYKNILMVSILEYLKKENKDKMEFFSLKMYEEFSRFLFDASPKNKDLIPLLLNNDDLEYKGMMKKNTFGFHISTMKFDAILGNEITEEVKSFFEIKYSEFLKERETSRQALISKENEIKKILKENKDNGE